VPVALHAAPYHRALEHVECGKQRGGAMSLVVMLVWTATDGIDMPE